ncbi:MAG: NitT/TauT family transport system substrate-binding protein [Methylobacteriaceae bacterium]|nr:NitT/TauT family transport system substrate-binding protein [Methylobacteriaceae bacterium]
MKPRSSLLRQLAILIAAVAASSAASAEELVRIGINGVISDAPFFIATEKGYFAEQGIKAEFIPFDAGPKMIAPLGAGQLDVAGGAASAGLFNAAARGIAIRVVADRGSRVPGYDYMPVLISKQLIDSGKVKGVGDLKGLKVAEAGEGGSQGSTLNEALKQAGLAYKDVEHVYMGYPQHVAALANGAIAASVTTEPSVTRAVETGVAIRFSPESAYPSQQVAVLLYGGDFIKKRPEIAQKFMIAFLKGARVYNDALKGGHLAGPAASEVIDILVKNTNIKDKALWAAIVPSGINPDGLPNVDSLKKDLAFYKEQKYLQVGADLESVLDLSFVEKAVQQLGPYKPTH